MLADFYIPMLPNDHNIAVRKNHLRGEIFTEVPLLKNGVYGNKFLA